MSVTPEERQTRQETVGSTTVRITSYKLGGEYVATVDNVDPGATIGRGKAVTREAAERQALEAARAGM